MFPPKTGRTIAALVLTALLSPGLAQAFPFFQDPSRSADPGFFERVWSLLTAVWSQNGGELDPNGTTSENGGQLDPDGVTVDNGGQLDPNG